MKNVVFGIAAVASGLLVAGSVSAGGYAVNAAGACNGALPSYEGALRKRPLGVQNEGSSPAFVTCSLPGSFQTYGNDSLVLAFTNQNAAPVDVNCTFVDDLTAPFGSPAYYPLTIRVLGNSARDAGWSAAQGELFSPWANVSCNLPAGVALNALEVQFDEPI